MSEFEPEDTPILKNIEAKVSGIADGDFFSFVLSTFPNEAMWVSDKLDKDVVAKIKIGDDVHYSAECNEDGDFVITAIEVI